MCVRSLGVFRKALEKRTENCWPNGFLQRVGTYTNVDESVESTHGVGSLRFTCGCPCGGREVAADGFEAGIKVMQFKPDLIILDLFMPLMDGFQVCRKLKNDPTMSDIKVLILTGYDTKENRDRIKKSGADSLLSKPVKKKTLLWRVEELLTKNKLNKQEVTKYGTNS